MYKAITLAGLGLLAFSSSLQAQHSSLGKSRTNWHASKSYAPLRATLLRMNPGVGTASKTTGTGQRLTATAGYYDDNGSLQLNDTTLIKYSGQRTSRFNMIYLYYDIDQSYAPLELDYKVDFDTAYFQQLSFMSPVDTSYVQRNAAGKVTKYYQGGYRLEDYTYNAQGVPATLVAQYFDNMTMQWENSSKSSYRYDAQNRLTADTSYYWDSNTSTWELNGVEVYSHNAANLPTQALLYSWNNNAFELEYRASVSYTAANLYALSKFESWDGSSFILEGKDSFAYGAGNALTYFASYMDFGQSLIKVTEEKRHLNSANLPDSVTRMDLDDPFTMTYQKAYARLTWNSFGNPVTQSWREDGSTTLREMQRYYYTSFQTSQSVASTPARKSLTVFPNPADNQLSISPDFSGRYELSIVNAAGQTVLRSNGSANGGQAFSLPLSNLAPGQYWLQLQNGEGAQYGASFLRK